MDSHATATTTAGGTGESWAHHARFFTLVGTAFVTIFVTTADDAFWLVPYLSPRYSCCARVSHALAFICALQIAVWSAWGLVLVFGAGVLSTRVTHKLTHFFGYRVTADALLAVFAALFAWCVVIVLGCKACAKRRRKAAAASSPERSEDWPASAYGATDAVVAVDPEVASLVAKVQPGKGGGGDGGGGVGDDNGDNEEGASSSARDAAAPCSVLSLALIGGLDEALYYPALLLGGTFTVTQLSIGALLTGLAMLLILSVARLLLCCAPILNCVDRAFPMWAVVALFATLLSVQAAVAMEPRSTEKA